MTPQPGFYLIMGIQQNNLGIHEVFLRVFLLFMLK